MKQPIAIGFDLGSKTLGIAFSDSLGLLAHPHSTLTFHSNKVERILNQLDEIVDEIKPEIFVLGLPMLLNGDLGPRAQISLDFKALLEQRYLKEVVLMDERFSTLSAEKSLIALDMKRNKRKQVIDQVAAIEILQRYLDQRRSTNESRNDGRNSNDC